jgi:hypothetical protein
MNFRIALLSLCLLSGQLFAQTINTFPYSEGFEGAEGTLNENFPSGWTWEDLNTNTFGNSNWQIIKNTDIAQNAHTDSTAVHMFSNSSENNNDWLYTPPVYMQAGYVYTLKFWYSVSAFLPSVEKLKVHVGSAPTALAMQLSAPLWDNNNITSAVYAQATINYTPTTTGLQHFAFHYYSAEFQFILLMDDVEITTNAPVNVNPVEIAAANIFPNPFADFVQINTTANSGFDYFEVLDIAGKIVLQNKLSGTSQLLNTADWPVGIYMVKMYSHGMEPKVIKLYKK